MKPTNSTIQELSEVYRRCSAPEQAAGMRKYMRDRFEFLGIPGPLRQQLSRPFLGGNPTERDLLQVALGCWDLPEREFQYFACDYLRRHAKVLTPAALPTLRTLVTTKPWWDTVDALAANVVGAVVAADQTPMDAWIAEDDPWVARTALLHQLRYRDRTDQRRLWAYTIHWKDEEDFFIRKAIGWALREYAKTDPAAVRAFVAAHPDLSGLSRREALKNIGRDGGTGSA